MKDSVFLMTLHKFNLLLRLLATLVVTLLMAGVNQVIKTSSSSSVEEERSEDLREHGEWPLTDILDDQSGKKKS